MTVMGSPWDGFVDTLLESARTHLFQDWGLDIHETSYHLTSLRPEAPMTIDVLAVNRGVAVAIEIQAQLSQQDVNSLLSKMGYFKLAFPLFDTYRLYGAVAGLEIGAEVEDYAYQRGLLVIRPQGDGVGVTNGAEFEPAIW